MGKAAVQGPGRIRLGPLSDINSARAAVQALSCCQCLAAHPGNSPDLLCGFSSPCLSFLLCEIETRTVLTPGVWGCSVSQHL